MSRPWGSVSRPSRRALALGLAVLGLAVLGLAALTVGAGMGLLALPGGRRALESDTERAAAPSAETQAVERQAAETPSPETQAPSTSAETQAAGTQAAPTPALPAAPAGRPAGAGASAPPGAIEDQLAERGEDPGAVFYTSRIREAVREGNPAFARELLRQMQELHVSSVLVSEAEALVDQDPLEGHGVEAETLDSEGVEGISVKGNAREGDPVEGGRR